MKKILLPVDEGNISAETVGVATEFGQKLGAEIIILYVQPLSVATYPYADLPVQPNNKEEVDRITEGIISTAMAKFDKSGVKVVPRVMIGYAASEIVDCADTEKCDLIIMHTHGLGAARRFLMGSVTNKVVHHSNVPVLVLR